MALGIGEVANHKVCTRILHWPHPARPTEALGLLKRCLDIRHADVEDHVASVAYTAANTTRNAGSVAGGTMPKPTSDTASDFKQADM